jgi:hypothetical protein
MNHDEAEAFLAHYGKKGMKWGQRMAIRDAEIKAARQRAGAGAILGTLSPKTRNSVNSTALRNAKKSGNHKAEAKARAQYTRDNLLANQETSKEIAAGILVSAGYIAISALVARAAKG